MSDLPVTVAAVHDAAAAIAGAIAPSPVIAAPALSELAGAEIHLKIETLHRTGSFKERGALNKLLTLDASQRRAGVVAMSAGNHAQGVAYHARSLGIPATIVMPEGTPFIKIDRTEAFGAAVVLKGDSLGAAHESTTAAAAVSAACAEGNDAPDPQPSGCFTRWGSAAQGRTRATAGLTTRTETRSAMPIDAAKSTAASAPCGDLRQM